MHVGTLHFQCTAVLEEFGDDSNSGDVFCVNDPYRGGTHLNDVSFIRPIFADGELIAFAQNNPCHKNRKFRQFFRSFPERTLWGPQSAIWSPRHTPTRPIPVPSTPTVEPARQSKS